MQTNFLLHPQVVAHGVMIYQCTQKRGSSTGTASEPLREKTKNKKQKKSPKPRVELSASACQPTLIKNPKEVKDQASETHIQQKANISCLGQ
jgi:hypothetical protein